jgi:hypothetical protein
MGLPKFPHFREIDLTHKDIIKDHLGRAPLEASEYTFTNLFAFRDAYNFKVSTLKGNLIILKDGSPMSMFCPVGNHEIQTVMEEGFRFLERHSAPPLFERVSENFVQAHLMDNDRFLKEEERAHFDYVYDVRELVELKGRKFHDKKNKVNKFRNSYEYKYEKLTPDMIEECLEFEDYWCQERDCEKYYGLHRERCAILEMLRNFEALNLKGGIIRVENKIAALTLGEKLLPDTMVIHIEKAHADMPGIYQAINQEFLIHEAYDCRYVNREQDLGIEGLRHSKTSYNPVAFVKKYRVSKQREGK